MPLVELVKGERTSEATLEQLRQCSAPPATHGHGAQGRPRAAWHRLQHALLREAFHIIQEGVASIEDIDVAVNSGPACAFQPTAYWRHADMVGLDMVQAIDTYLFPELSAAAAPPAFLIELIARGDLGAKTGHGLYDWTQRTASDVLAARDRFIAARLRDARHIP